MLSLTLLPAKPSLQPKLTTFVQGVTDEQNRRTNNKSRSCPDSTFNISYEASAKQGALPGLCAGLPAATSEEEAEPGPIPLVSRASRKQNQDLGFESPEVQALGACNGFLWVQVRCSDIVLGSCGKLLHHPGQPPGLSTPFRVHEVEV